MLDTVLTGKSLYCVKHGITLTCMAEGALLNFMDVIDICTIFGNALDNAIEYVEKIMDKEKRLINLAVYANGELLMLRFENYCEDTLNFENGLPMTTKKDASYHGYGIKSIRSIAEKYGGSPFASWPGFKILCGMTQLNWRKNSYALRLPDCGRRAFRFRLCV